MKRRGAPPARGPTGSGKTEVYLQACERRSSAVAARSCSCRRSRSRRRRSAAFAHSATRSRSCTRRLGRPSGVTSASASLGRGPDRRRRPLRDLRADAGPRSDRPRRGARRLLQAGVRPALRRAHRGREARRLEGAVAVYGSATPRPRAGRARAACPLARIGAPMPRVRIVDLRREAGIRSRRRCSPSSAGSPSRAAGRSCSSTGAASRPRSTAGPAACRAAADLRRRADAARRRRGSTATTAAFGARPRDLPVCGSVELARIGAGTQRLETELERNVCRSSSGSGSTRTRPRGRERCARRSSASRPPTARC